MEELRLTFRTKPRPVVIEDEDGNQTRYNLFEMTAGERDRYMDQVKSRMEKTPDGGFSMSNFEGAQAELLSACLKREDGTPVAKDDIQKMPATIVSAMFAAAQAMNKVGGEPEKKD